MFARFYSLPARRFCVLGGKRHLFGWAVLVLAVSKRRRRGILNMTDLVAGGSTGRVIILGVPVPVPVPGV